MEELLSLKWNNHKSTFIHVLGILRDKQLYTDATIACEGKFYNVHKLVLSTCSDYFSAMLDRTNCKNPVIVLKDIKCEDLEALLDYMYLGEVNVRQSDLATLIKAAECLRVKGLAVPDDEPPPPRKTKASENQSRRGDTSGSPPAKRKRRSEVDDGRDDVRPSKIENRSSSPIHRAKSPSAPMSTPLSPVHNRNTPVRQPTEATVPPSPKASMHLEDSNTDGNANNNSMTNNQGYQPSDHSEPFVKVEMDDGGGGEVETYDLSNEGGFKEEGGDDGAHSGGGGGESGGDLSNDLPEFLQQAASNPLQGGAFGHSSFAGSSSFQPGELPGWQGDGSNIGFPHLNFGSTEGSSQQNAPGARRSAGPAERSYTSGLSSNDLSTDHKRHQHSLQDSYPFPPAEERHQRLSADHLISSLAGNLAGCSGEDPKNTTAFVCPICFKHFAGSWHVTRHIRTHTGEKPFTCHYCDYKTSDRSCIKRHVMAIHPERMVDDNTCRRFDAV